MKSVALALALTLTQSEQSLTVHSYFGVTDSAEIQRIIQPPTGFTTQLFVTGHHVYRPRAKDSHILRVWVESAPDRTYEVYVFCLSTTLLLSPTPPRERTFVGWQRPDDATNEVELRVALPIYLPGLYDIYVVDIESRQYARIGIYQSI
jgi:hypothetical protein